jgi:hypothetical protein
MTVHLFPEQTDDTDPRLCCSLQKSSFVHDSIMEYEQTALDKGKVHAPFLTLFQEHSQLFE